MIDFNELIPEMGEWNNGEGIDLEGWIGCLGNFRLAVGYSAIFWPRLVEFEQYVLREGFSLGPRRDFERACGGDRRKVEAVMNHLHIADIQHYGCKDINRQRVVYLGRVLSEIYKAKLAWQFPTKQFEVWFNDSAGDDLIAYQLTFYQI
ncbi:MAG: hypothetical protein ACP5O7_06115 [Phycisphaerae bacterium]